MSLKSPAQVKDVAVALSKLTQGEFHRRYLAIPFEDYDADLTEDDFEYTWSWYQGVRGLYHLASSEGKYVLFTADQKTPNQFLALMTYQSICLQYGACGPYLAALGQTSARLDGRSSTRC